MWNTLNANRTLKNSFALSFQDYHLGYKLEHDLSKLKSLYGVLALKNEKGDFFLKSDLLKQQFSVGCNHIHGSGALHSIEVLYDHSKKTNGIMGQPLTLGFGGEYTLTPDITLKTKLNLKDEAKLATSWIHRFDKNLRFVFSDEFNLTKTIKEPTKTNYNFGLLLEYLI